MFVKLRLRFSFFKLKNELKKVRDKNYNSEEIIDALFDKKFSLIQPWQYKSEFSKLLAHYSNLKPSKIMEIGTANGGTLFAHCKLASENATIISVDLPGGKFGGGYPAWKISIYNEFAKSNQHLHLIRGSSYDQETFEKVKKILGTDLLDYILIDGDHTYDGVKKDFDMYSPLVKKGGSIVFHDIALHNGSTCQVDLFWKDIKSNYEHYEFIQDKDHGKFGIGILIK